MGTYNEFQHSSCLTIVLHGETRHCLTGSVTQSLLYWPSICLVVSVFTWFLQHKMKTNVIEQHFTDVSSTKSVEEKRLMKKSKICAKIIETSSNKSNYKRLNCFIRSRDHNQLHKVQQKASIEFFQSNKSFLQFTINH